MGRLIDAEKLFKDLFIRGEKLCPDRDVDNFPVTVNVKDVKKAIKNQPTAYDVDKVVKQLEDATAIGADCVGNAFECIPKYMAIEIVKAGEVDAKTNF